MTKNTKAFLHKCKLLLLGITLLAILYVIGTFNPNFYVVEKIVAEEHNKAVKEMNSLGLFEPSFEYSDPSTFIAAVYKCIDYVNYTTELNKRIPSGLIVAMAGVESGWGTSRFAVKGNNLFGIRTWDPKVKQMKPLDLPDARFGVKVYKTKCDSIKDTVRILNNHPAYAEFRKERDRQYKEKITDWETLVPLVAPWSTNEKYGAIILETIIKREL